MPGRPTKEIARRRRSTFLQRLYRQEFTDRGLTVRGTPRRYVIDRPELRGLVGKAREREQARLEAERAARRNYARGLTARGTERKYCLPKLGFYPRSQSEQRWKAFLSNGTL